MPLPQNDPNRETKSGSPFFWTVWHVTSLVIVLTVPAYYHWRVSLVSLPLSWMPTVVAMGAAYLGLAMVVALVRPAATLRGVFDVVVAGASAYGVALVLLSFRPDIPAAPQLVVLSMLLAVALVLLPILLQRRRAFCFVIPAVLILAVVGLWSQEQKLGGIPLQVAFGNARALSKVPFVIALDQRIFEKYGLNVSFWIPPAEGDSEVPASPFARPARPDILVDGHSPIIYRMVTEANFPPMIALAGGDCMAHNLIVGKRGLKRLEDLKGKRLGVNQQRSTTTFVAQLLARRMGWDPVLDISILQFGRDAESLRTGVVDAIVAEERNFAELQAEGYPILADTLDWNDPIAGNSVLVDQDWLKAPGHRDVALRFLKASAEGFALFHRNPELARQTMAKWNGNMGTELAEAIYNRGDSFPRKPYPCYDGIKKTMELYDSNEMRRYTPEAFYDDSFMRELDKSGFLDSLYE